MRRARVIGFLTLIISLAISQTAPTASAKHSNRQQEKTPPTATINPGSLDFGDQVTKSVSRPQRVTVTNAGEKPLYINSVVINGDNREDFAIVNDTCTGATVPSKKSCIIDVSITPAEIGSRILLKNGATVHLTPKAFETLLVLVQIRNLCDEFEG
jgi:hypothetical protein